jgi:hypothetical protein
MGFLVGSQNGVRGGGCFRSLIRRKQVDSVHFKRHGHHQLAKELSVPHLIAIGIFFFFFFWIIIILFDQRISYAVCCWSFWIMGFGCLVLLHSFFFATLLDELMLIVLIGFWSWPFALVRNLSFLPPLFLLDMSVSSLLS